MLVPYGPGGVDYQIRALAPALGNLLGQQIVVENREGGGAIIGTAAVKSAPPDGYTLLFTGTAALSVVPHLRKAPYVIRDFEPIGNVTATPLIVTARGNAPFKTLAELLAHARANPGKVNMGSAGSGTSTHIVGEAFQAAAGIEFTHVPFRGVGAATNAMLSGDVDLVIGVPGVMVPHFATGKLVALASTGKARSEFVLDVPSLFEDGPRRGRGDQVRPPGAERDTGARVATADRCTRPDRDSARIYQPHATDVRHTGLSASDAIPGRNRCRGSLLEQATQRPTLFRLDPVT